MKLAELLIKYRKEHRMSQREFAEKCHLSHGYLNILEKEINPNTGKPTAPSVDKMTNIASALGMTLHELLSTIDDMQVTIPALPKDIKPISQMQHHYVPLIGSVAAGEPLFCETNYDLVIDAPKKADFALRVQGESMVPTFLPNDVVYIRQQDDVEDGQIAVVIIDDSATLKHVYHQPGGLLLISDNPAYSPMHISAEEHEYLKILGKVCGYTRMM